MTQLLHHKNFAPPVPPIIKHTPLASLGSECSNSSKIPIPIRLLRPGRAPGPRLFGSPEYWEYDIMIYVRRPIFCHLINHPKNLVKVCLVIYNTRTYQFSIPEWIQRPIQGKWRNIEYRYSTKLDHSSVTSLIKFNNTKSNIMQLYYPSYISFPRFVSMELLL